MNESPPVSDMDLILGDFAASLKKQGKQPATVAAYLRDARSFLEFLGKISFFRLRQVDQEVVDRFQAHLRKTRAHRANSFRRTLLGTRQFFRHLVDRQILRANPLEETAIPTRREVKPPRLERPTIEKLFSTASLSTSPLKQARDTALLELLCHEGLKSSEIVELRWNDLVFDDSLTTLRVRGDRARLIPLAAPTTQAIHQWRLASEALGSRGADTPRAPMFVAFKGPHCEIVLPSLARHGLKFLIYELGEGVGLTHLNAETLRAYAIGHLLQRQWTAPQIMKHLGLRRIGNIARYTSSRGKSS